MKKKLSQWRIDMAGLKTAWQTALKDNTKSIEEKEQARAAYKRAMDVIDEAEASGAKDDDEIEDKADGGIDVADLKKIVGDAVKAEIDRALPENQRKQLTEDSIKNIINAAFKSQIQAGKQPDESGVKSIVAEAMKEAMATIRKGSKMQHSTEDDRQRVEIPVSWCKGNLPLHGAQLFNIIAGNINEQHKHSPDRQIKLVEYTAEQVREGQIKGEQMLAKYKSKAINEARSGGYVEAQKALTSTGANAGDELVPTDLASELQRRFYLGTPFGALIAAREIAMPTNPFDIPLRTTIPKFYHESVERTATTESAPGTAKPSLSAKKFMGETDFSYEVDEDAIIAVLPFCQEQLSTGAAQAYEDALINGDTAGTQDVKDAKDDVTIAGVANHHYRAFDGIRKLTLAVAATKVSLAGTGIVDEANCRAILKSLRKYGLNPRELVWLVGVSGYNQMLGISNVTTIEKYGARATIVTGELTSFMGIPVLTSAFAREDLNAAGVHDDVTETKGSLILVNPMGFMTGSRRDFMVETFRNIQKQEMQIVASFRKAFIPMETLAAGFTPASIGYNWTA